MNVLLLIPCYNCSEQVRRVLKSLIHLPSQVGTVLLIDNCSQDGTLNSILDVRKDLPSELSQKITVVQNFQNYGLGGSFKLAVKYAVEKGFTHLAILHGDDQADVQTLVEMTSLLEKEPLSDALLGARFHPLSKLENYSGFRSLTNRCLNVLFSLALRKKIWDIGSGINLYRVNSLPYDEVLRYPDHLAFDLQLLIHFSSEPYRMSFVPCVWRQSDQKSNVRFFKLLRDIMFALINHLLGRKTLLPTADHQRGFVEVSCE